MVNPNTHTHDRTTPVELTNMIMIENATTGQLLVQHRVKDAWSGLAFPGGHIEPGETVTASVYREALEETGLVIAHPQFVGIKEWPIGDGVRYIVFLYKTTEYQGELQAREGALRWLTRAEILSGDYELPNTFAEMFQVFDDTTVNELALGVQDAQGQRVIRWE